MLGYLNVCPVKTRISMEILLSLIITKIYLYKFDPLKPHFYMVKLGFKGVDIIFLISAQKCEKISEFLSENFQFLEVKFSIYLNRRVFVMSRSSTFVCRSIGHLVILHTSFMLLTFCM